MSHFSVIFFTVPLLLANKRKDLKLHEQNIDHGKIFKWWSPGSHCAH